MRERVTLNMLSECRGGMMRERVTLNMLSAAEECCEPSENCQ